MKLNVPLKQQEKKSRDCGLMSLLMVLEYFGIKKEFTDIQKEIAVDSVGTYAPQMGSFLIKNGFEVTLITQHPGLFTISDRGKSQRLILVHIKNLLKIEKNKQNRKVLKYFIEFLNKGGKITIKIPDKEDIEGGIKNDFPLIALMTTAFLTDKKPQFNFHFNVITGIDKNYIYRNDPGAEEKGGKKKTEISDFMFGLYASIYGDLDNGSLLQIIKK